MKPRATVRLQLQAAFTLRDALQRVPYYAELGISHFYLSPITRAVAGSTHGYDVVDPAQVSPELGGEASLRRLADALHARGMGLIADIVPNHMAAHPDNPWWADVLRHGASSRWAATFDIQWRSCAPALRGRLLLPVLPAPYERCLRRGEVTLVSEEGSCWIRAGGGRYPLADGSLGDPAAALQACADPADGWRRLHRILQRQHYRLAWWRTAADHINWRRFFEVSSLVGVKVELPEVFEALHALPLRLCAQGVLDGLRVDHVDGLAEPGAYLRRLRARLGKAPYLIVEKILAADESLDPRWPVEGTTGYDFLDEAGSVLHDPRSQQVLRAHWIRLAGDGRDPAALLAQIRRSMLDRNFGAERRALVEALWRMLRLGGASRDWTAPAVDRLMTTWLAAFPVYRTYAEDGGPSPMDLAHAQAAGRACDVRGADAGLLRRLMSGLYGTPVPDARGNARSADAACRRALIKLQQLTPPLAAKALEDTLFYRYGPLLSRNEVGATPRRYAMSLGQFHDACLRRARDLPHAMLATATHDHKRGEDTRARLAALSEIPDRWVRLSSRWLRRWPPPVTLSETQLYMLVQTLVGTWPPDLPAGAVDTPDEALRDWLARVAQWQEKALREAKLCTSWMDPDLAFEHAVRSQLLDLPQNADGRRWLREVAAFAEEIAAAGMINSLAQVLLRIAAPGMPDLYQGADLWDFSLVDPDNRRPVDYGLRERMLQSARTVDPGEPAHWRSGAVKQALLARALQARRSHRACFGMGAYIPVAAIGPRARHVIAFVRKAGDDAVLAVAPRLCATRLADCARGAAAHARRFWDDTRLYLPACAWPATALRNVLDGTILEPDVGRCLPMAQILADWPVAMAVAAPPEPGRRGRCAQ